MEWLFGPLLAAVVIGAVVLYVLDNRKWVQFYGASGMRPESAVGVQAALQHAGVRHRYQTSGAGGNAMGGHASAGQTIQIL
ncbi:MAG: hypothetical protein WD645_03350, partial [Dehalococcoidia bacterium]